MKIKLSAYKIIDDYSKAAEQQELNRALTIELNAEGEFRINDKASRPKLRACHFLSVVSEDEAATIQIWRAKCEANEMILLPTTIGY